MYAFAASSGRQGLVSQLGGATTRSIIGISSTGTRAYSSTTSLNAVQYLLTYDYVPDILERRDPHRPGHVGLAKKLIAEGKCESGGPIGEVGMTVPTGALFVFNDEASAKQFAAEDPYMTAGLVTSHTIQEWNVVVQKEE
jgi:uncharacterized protein YciI